MEQVNQDALLLRDTAQGDKAAFAKLLAAHLPAILAFIRRYIRDSALAEDLAQETFTRVWQHAARWQPREVSPRSWIYKIAYHLCMDELRRRKPLDIEAHEPIESQGPEQHLMNERQSDHLHTAMNLLPERQRTALYLCAWQGLGNKEAAAILAISVEALESLLARARRQLKDYFTRLESEHYALHTNLGN